MGKTRKRSRPRKNMSDDESESESESDSDSDYHHRDSTGDGRLEHNLSETQRSLTRSMSPLLAQCALRTSPRLKKHPIRDVIGNASPSTLTPPLKTGLLETTPASQTFNLVVSQEPQEIAVPFTESTTKKRRGRPRKIKEILVKEELGHSRHLNTTAAFTFDQKEPIGDTFIPEELAVLRESTAKKKRGRPRKVKEILEEEELGNSSHLNATASDSSFDQKEPSRVIFCPEEPQMITLEHGPELAVSNTPVALSSPTKKDQCLDQPLSLDHTDIIARLFESPEPDEDDSMLDTNMVKVDEYIVKKEIAPLLKSILAKQGNIAMHCIVESITNRSSLLENVCGLYQKLEKKDPKRIKVSEVKSMLYEVEDFEKAGLEVNWLRERLDGIAKTLEESKEYFLMKTKLDWNNEDIKRKKKEVDELEAMTSLAQNELATFEAKGMELYERMSDMKVKWERFFEENLVEGLL